MPDPFPGISVVFETKAYSLELLDTDSANLNQYVTTKEITNYEYELNKNEEKRKILLLKPEYIGAFINDVKNMMKYGKSSQYVDDTTKRVYNPKLKGV